MPAVKKPTSFGAAKGQTKLQWFFQADDSSKNNTMIELFCLSWKNSWIAKSPFKIN